MIYLLLQRIPVRYIYVIQSGNKLRPVISPSPGSLGEWNSRGVASIPTSSFFTVNPHLSGEHGTACF